MCQNVSRRLFVLSRRVAMQPSLCRIRLTPISMDKFLLTKNRRWRILSAQATNLTISPSPAFMCSRIVSSSTYVVSTFPKEGVWRLLMSTSDSLKNVCCRFRCLTPSVFGLTPTPLRIFGVVANICVRNQSRNN